MPDINPYFSDLVRTDSLTNAGNHIAFFDWLFHADKQATFTPFSLLSIQMRDLQKINETSGLRAGDTALRWAANLIKEQTQAPTFRMGSEFITILSEVNPNYQAEIAKRVFDALNKNCGTVALDPPAATVAAIAFFDREHASPEGILSAYYGGLYFMRQKPDVPFKVFDSRSMSETSGFLAYVVHHTVSRFTSIGKMLDQSNELAFTDTISGLPNARAAIIKLDETIQRAQQDRTSFSILIVDGDTLSNYNKFSYAGGDELIQRLGNTLRSEIRPTDYIARWKSGDQFLVILEGALPQFAAKVGERMRVAIEESSKDWMIRSTISVGVAGCPQHGKTPERVIEVAESALKRAKELGKNRVAIFS
jgi:diguanylate cyclase (GGDEF)-like protein